MNAPPPDSLTLPTSAAPVVAAGAVGGWMKGVGYTLVAGGTVLVILWIWVVLTQTGWVSALGFVALFVGAILLLIGVVMLIIGDQLPEAVDSAIRIPDVRINLAPGAPPPAPPMPGYPAPLVINPPEGVRQFLQEASSAMTGFIQEAERAIESAAAGSTGAPPTPPGPLRYARPAHPPPQPETPAPSGATRAPGEDNTGPS